MKNAPLVGRLLELGRLKNGWYEGRGIAPNAIRLITLAQKLADSYPEHLPFPVISPKQDGNLLLEWDADGDPSLDIELASMLASFHAFGLNGEDIERDFRLGASGEFESFLTFLSEQVRPR